MLSAEGMGLSIGFASLFITLVGVAVTLTKNMTVIKVTLDFLSKEIEEGKTSNHSDHKELFQSQDQTNRIAAATDQHLVQLNGSVKRNKDDIAICFNQIHDHDKSKH